jgi:multimeric flavodoxin WrbA
VEERASNMDQRLIAVYGSPRKRGNTELLLDCFLDGASVSDCQVERVYLRELGFKPCTECGGCEKTGRCVLDDGIKEVYEKLLECEKAVFSYPVFFLGPPAITKAFIDRGQAFWQRKYVLGIDPPKTDSRGRTREAFLLSIGGFEGSEKIFRCNVSILRSLLLVCGLRYTGDLFAMGIDRRGEFEKREGLCEQAREAGRSFVS